MPSLREQLEHEKQRNETITQKYWDIYKEYEKLKKEVGSKRRADEDSKMLIFLRPPKFAKNQYLEQKPAKYVFKCMDGDIQIPEYGLLRTDFYYQARIELMILNSTKSSFRSSIEQFILNFNRYPPKSNVKPEKDVMMEIFSITRNFQNQASNILRTVFLAFIQNVMILLMECN